MRINDIIYFSPSLQLAKLDLNDKSLVLKHFPERIKAYYLEPIENLVKGRMAFAAGAIEFLLIDAFSRYSSTEDRVGVRIKAWSETYLQLNTSTAKDFYDFFRCGILHEAHIKQFGQFSFDPVFAKDIQKSQGYIVVNPANLLASLYKYLDLFILELNNHAKLYDVFLARLEMDFEEEIKLAK